MTNDKRINKELQRKYGTCHDGRPFFRVVWSTSQLEKRFGTFNDFTPSGIFIRQFHGLREVKKYMGPDFKDYWVLERLRFEPNDEIWDSKNGHYEPLWVCRAAKTGERLRPVFKACDIICFTSLWGVEKMRSDYLQEEKDEEAREVELFENMLDDERPWLAQQLVRGSAIIVPGGAHF